MHMHQEHRTEHNWLQDAQEKRKYLCRTSEGTLLGEKGKTSKLYMPEPDVHHAFQASCTCLSLVFTVDLLSELFVSPSLRNLCTLSTHSESITLLAWRRAPTPRVIAIGQEWKEIRAVRRRLEALPKHRIVDDRKETLRFLEERAKDCR